MTDKPLNIKQPKRNILAVMLADLIRRSQRTGRPAARTLSGGASILVVTRDDEVRVLVARRGTPLGDVELRTFRALLPEDARRWPTDGQSTMGSKEAGWTWRVGWKWTVENSNETEHQHHDG